MGTAWPSGWVSMVSSVKTMVLVVVAGYWLNGKVFKKRRALFEVLLQKRVL